MLGHKDKNNKFHPHNSGKDGVSEKDLNISQKGNNDTIVVEPSKTKGMKGNRDLRNTIGELLGNVYVNNATGNEWRIIKIGKELIKLRDNEGNEFDTTPDLMINYSYIGTSFTDNKKKRCPKCNANVMDVDSRLHRLAHEVIGE